MSPSRAAAFRKGLERLDADPVPPSGTHAAVAIILCGSNLELLLIRRAEHPQDPWSGHMALPGGRREEKDEDLLATAIRETKEEVDVQLTRRECLGQLPASLARGRRGGRKMWVTPFVFQRAGSPETRADESEVSEVHFAPLLNFRSEECRGEVEIQQEGQRFALPAWMVKERPVWGVTYAILRDLLDRVEPHFEPELTSIT